LTISNAQGLHLHFVSGMALLDPTFRRPFVGEYFAKLRIEGLQPVAEF
jgi:hypothetical protein